jgi:transposase
MVLCLLVYKLAEWRVRQQLASTGQTIPDQVRKPTQRPTMRWIFQCFEGIDLHHTFHLDGTVVTEVLRLTALHGQVLRWLGPRYERIYGLAA